MKQEERVRQHPPPNNANQTAIRIQGRCDDSQTSPSEPFTFRGMNEDDRIREVRQLKNARRARREQLEALGLHPSDHRDDLDLARGVAAVDRIRPPTRDEDEAFRAMLQRVAERGVRRLESRSAPENSENFTEFRRGEVA